MSVGNPNYVPLSTLVEYELDTRNMGLRDLLREDEGLPNNGLDFNPPYQRASVWTMEQRGNLLKSLIQGLPIGAIFINDRGDFVKRIVDGKQRLETYQMWLDDKIVLPAEWFTPTMLRVMHGDPPYVIYDSLVQRAKNFFNNSAFTAVYWTKLRTVEEEAELYARINYGGTPHEQA